MATEYNRPNHRYYQKRYHVKLAVQDICKQFIYASGIKRIDNEVILVPLFSLAEPGVWYDPSDLTTLFQDVAGTQPVTAAGQTVALALDKSKGLALGPELVTNGDFSSGTTGWAGQGSGTPISVVGGALVVTEDGADGVSARAFQVVTTVVGRTYRLSLDVTAAVGRGQIAVNPVNQNLGGAIYTRGPLGTGSLRTVTAIFTATSTTSYIILDSGTTVAGTVTFDNVSVRELAGNHATQSILASRPTYALHPSSGIRNVANGSADVGNTTTWRVTTQNGITTTRVGSGFDADGLPYVDFRYQGTATGTVHDQIFNGQMSQSATSGQSYTTSVIARVIAGSTAGVTGLVARTSEFTAPSTFIGISVGNSVTASTDTVTNATRAISTGNLLTGSIALNFTNGATIDVTYRIKALQFELGSTRTAYQFNYANFNIVEAPFAQVPNLLFDGIDDFLLTPTITPNTDKVQVFAGVRKQSDAANGVIVELGSSVFVTNGSFWISAPDPTAPSATVQYASRGTVVATLARSALPSPQTMVVTGASSISTDNLTLRVNQVETTNSGDQGTGNYANAPIYIGRRGGTSLPFNGRLYGLVVRFGPNLDAATIAATEAWMNTKTGAY